MNFSSTKKLILKLLVLSIFISSIFVNIGRVHAVAGVADSVIINADTSPTGISNYLNSTWTYLNDFVLKKAVVLAAKQLLHQITLSVIDWINHGFEGSPAFLSNPGAFFLDAADQVTGAFLATNGPLSALCSPFAIDIRLSLALSKTNLSTERYTCTVGKIIEAQKNGPDIIVNGKVVRSSNSSYNGFLKGDFNQGGWPAFLALTTEPQNNPYGAFLSAQADLDARINSRQNVIRADLQLGQGFMSWQSCKDVPGGTYDPEDAGQVQEVNGIVGNDAGTRVKKNKNGTETVQTCETQTPGSVIANQLHTSLNVPTVELELANDINAIFDALVSRLTMEVLGGGLKNFSTGGSNSASSIMAKEISSQEALKNTEGSLKDSIKTSIAQVPKFTDQYKVAVTELTAIRNKYTSVRSCLAERQNSTGFNGGLTDIDNTVFNEIDPLIQKYQKKYDDGMKEKADLQEMLSKIDNDPSTQIQAQSIKFTNYLTNGGASVISKIDSADTELAEARAKARELDGRLSQYNYMCIGYVQ